MEKEIWKDVREFEGLYQVSNFGRVKSLTRKVKCANNAYRTIKGTILATSICNAGYEGLVLRKDNKSYPKMVHKLVADAFLGECKNGFDVDHIDYNKRNNNFSNLQIISHLENVVRSKPYKKEYDKSGENNPRAMQIIMVDGETETIVSNCGKHFCKILNMNYSTFRYKMKNGGIIKDNILYKYGTNSKKNCKERDLYDREPLY